jgi:hypothetical protein
MSRISFASAHVWRCRLTHYIAASVKLAQPTPHRSINRARYGCITRRPTAHRTRSIIRLIQKWLRAGVLEEEVVTVSDRGPGRDQWCCHCLPMSTSTTLSTSGLRAGDRLRLRAT